MNINDPFAYWAIRCFEIKAACFAFETPLLDKYSFFLALDEGATTLAITMKASQYSALFSFHNIRLVFAG
ncbi:hypothetical protein AYO28_22205 [Pseudomonas putida]|uniref:Uncharacterized protein n=1 Tax=Pseudomonas putida TaxID=303 RepID=A0A177SLS0_PSEPU|nr:hypothetical protein AYO28_22205 [Pseudomonas putida]